MTNLKKRESPDAANDLEPEPTAGETILVVSKRTGFPMATLRAWERRYGFPRPERKAGSNRRLYSQSDIERLGALRRALDSGFRIGDVMGMSAEALDALAVRTNPRNALPPRSSREPAPIAPLSPTTAREVSPDELLSLLARDDVEGLENELRRAGASLGPRRFVTEIAQPFAERVGTAWAVGELSIRQEHVATECLLTRLRAHFAAYQDMRGSPLVLLATLPGEPHGLALQMVGLYLVTAGAGVRTLGVATPIEEIVEASRAYAADVVGLTVTSVTPAATTRRSVTLLRGQLDARVSLWLGGSAAHALGPMDGDVSLVTAWNTIDEALSTRRKSSALLR